MYKWMMLVLLSSLMVGCATNKNAPTWTVIAQGDEFSDITGYVVTTGDRGLGGQVLTRQSNYYPVIGQSGDDLYFGLMSGGKYKIPVGNVQVRIDENTAWDISASETPQYLLTNKNEYPVIDYGLDGEQAEIVRRAQEQAMSGYSRAVNSVTAVGGEKAKQIIKQMISGQKMIYRATVINMPTSTTGQVDLDESLRNALQKVGINPDLL